jgi:hypothetical protein
MALVACTVLRNRRCVDSLAASTIARHPEKITLRQLVLYVDVGMVVVGKLIARPPFIALAEGFTLAIVRIVTSPPLRSRP